MKIKLKLIIDALLLGAILVCMKYDFTGGLIHEILGFVLVSGLIAHVAWNRKYYAGMARALSRRSLGFKQKITFVINIILLVALIVMIITSVAISKDVLVFLNLNVSNYMLWYVLHVASAIALLVCALIHTFLHEKLIRTVISSTLKLDEMKASCNGAVRVAAVILAVLVIKTSFTGGLQLADRISSASMVQGRKQNAEDAVAF